MAALARTAAARAGLDWKKTNYLTLRRGPYIVAAGLDESVPGDPENPHTAASSISSTRNWPSAPRSRSPPARAPCS